MKPTIKPNNPNFSSGPCSKHPGFSIESLKDCPFGRSHRSAIGKKKLSDAIEISKELLGIPADYLVGIVPGSDTGAFEMAMWSALGERPVDSLYWEAFGKGWATEIKNELKIEGSREINSEYGELPDFSQVNFDHDVTFTWNGTTSGVKVPNGDWIPDDRKGLTLCDATSAVFAMDIPWQKLDITTYSWQKVLGGEGGHGIIILSPRAVARIENNTPKWPMPKVFKLAKDGKLISGIFQGSTINTPSMLANEDYLDALNWVKANGGITNMKKLSKDNLALFTKFVADNDWIHFLAKEEAQRSSTSITFSLDLEAEQVNKLVKLLAAEEVAYDCKAYRDAPTGLRFWGGSTIEKENIAKMLPWLKWAYEEVK